MSKSNIVSEAIKEIITSMMDRVMNKVLSLNSAAL